MSTKKQLPQVYGKQISAPLAVPQTDSAVNYAQLPENIMWLSGNRGFKKRYGSLPCSYISVPDTSEAAANAVPPPGMLSVVRAPFWNTISRTVDAAYFGSSMLLVSVANAYSSQPGSNAASRLYKGLKVRTTNATLPLTLNQPTQPVGFYRAVYDRSDSNYYFVQGALTAAVTIDPTLPVSTAKTNIEVTGNAGSSGYGQSAYPFVYNRPESLPATIADSGNLIPRGGEKSYSSLFCTELKNTQAVDTSTSPHAPGVPYSNRDASQAISTSTGIFVGGGGSSVAYTDGFVVRTAGAPSLASTTLNATINGAGSLTGTYKYFSTYRIRLPSGETIEGEPTPTVTLAPAAQQVKVVPNLPVASYEYDIFSTATTGTVTAIVYSAWSGGAAVLEVGQQITFFISNTRAVRTITAVSGTTITIDSSIALAGTTYFSLGSSCAIYRTVAGGSVFYLLAELPISGSITHQINDNAADNTLVTEYASTATLRLPPPNCVHAIADHQGRLVVLATESYPYLTSPTPTNAASTPTLWWSSGTSRLYFDPDLSTTFKYSGRDKPTGLVSINDTLYVFMENAIYMITGSLDDATTYTVSCLSDIYGCIASRSIVTLGSTIVFLSRDGLRQIKGSSVESYAKEATEKALKRVNLRYQAAYHWKEENLLLVSANEIIVPHASANIVANVSTGTIVFSPAVDDSVDWYDAADSIPASAVPPIYTSVAKTLVQDLVTEKWAIWDIDIRDGVTEFEGDLITFGKSFYGKLGTDTDPNFKYFLIRYSKNCNWTDSGKAFTARFYSEWFDAGVPSVDKSFDRAQIFSTDTAEAGGQGFKLTVRTERDWQPGLTVDEFTDITDFKVDYGYAEQPYASQPYGDPELSQKVLPLSNQRCKSLRLVLENSEPNRNMAINAVAVEVNPKYANMKDE